MYGGISVLKKPTPSFDQFFLMLAGHWKMQALFLLSLALTAAIPFVTGACTGSSTNNGGNSTTIVSGNSSSSNSSSESSQNSSSSSWSSNSNSSSSSTTVNVGGADPILSGVFLAESFNLPSVTTLAFPSSTMSSAQSFIQSSWNIDSQGSFGLNNLAFVSDPFNTTDPVPVLQTTYEAGTFSQGTGGAQFYAIDAQSATSSGGGFHAMLLSYTLAFDENFDWNKGGKLPGVRGGPVVEGCSGGRQPNGSDCFSARLMWRENGEGEGMVYFQVIKG